MRMDEAIQSSKRGIAARPYFADYRIMDDKRVAAFVSTFDGKSFDKRFADTGAFVQELGDNDSAARGFTDWQPLEVAVHLWNETYRTQYGFQRTWQELNGGQ